MYAYKWIMPRMLFSPDDGGGGGEASVPAADGGGSANAGSGVTADAAPSTANTPEPSGGGEAATPAPFDWSALGSNDDLDHIEVPPEPAPPVAKPEPPKESVAQPVEPPKAPQPAQQPQTPSEAPAPPLTAADPLRIAEAIEANRDAAIAHLATSKFALSEQEIKDLDADPSVAVPRLLARVFVESQVSMQKFLAQAVPGMVQKFNKVSSANEGAEKKFFERHKALNMNDPTHRATTVRIASVYRQANPNIPLDQLIDEVGPMVMAALRINGGAPAAPVPQGVPQGRRAGPIFTPAVNGGGGLSPSTEPASEWAGLGRNYDE